MRFLRPLELLVLASASVSLSTVSFSEVDAKIFQIDATADNSFQVYTSTGSSVTHLKAGSPLVEQQDEWQTPSVYQGVILNPGDVISIYVHNDVSSSGTSQNRLSNPSAIVARIRETNSDTKMDDFKVGGEDYMTDDQWICAWRHESTEDQKGYNPARLTGNVDDWAKASGYNLAQPFAPLDFQNGGSNPVWGKAWEIAPLGTAIWNDVDDNAIVNELNGPLPAQTPFWIYGNHQLDESSNTNIVLAHHGWCRFTIPTTGPNVPGGTGDPVFTGFQGQVYQFHGLPDEHFNLVSSPQVQLNAHFVYLSSGKCDYNETACYTHPGTYMDVLGFTIAETRVKLVAGTHEAGLRVWINDIELARGERNFSLSERTQASIKFHKNGQVHIKTEIMEFEVSNSDMFMNVGVTLLNQELLRVGAKKHTITDKALCKHNEGTYDHELVESKVSEKYPISTPLHGLIGQTWRNLKICGHEWMGTVQDYVVSSLFGTDYHYKYFQY